MRIVRSTTRQRVLSAGWRRKGLCIGLVPTMGALHAGHLSLVRASTEQCDRTVVSIFVNPLQFGPREDLREYPRPRISDRNLLARSGVHVLFAPSAVAMYPPGFTTAVEVHGSLLQGLCAPFRPGHFRGVTTVVTKLLHVVQPHVVYFGQKDAQQNKIIQQMTRDLDLDCSLKVLPIVREPDGLALSSRNRLLTAMQRRSAPVLYGALCAGRALIGRGARRASVVRAVMRRILATESRVRVQYLAIVRAQTLQPVARLRGKILLAVAAWLGHIRLIDNLVVRVPQR